MKYRIEDIKFDEITPRQFENLCYDLLVKYNFRNLIWREGGADNGRDIEATLSFSTMLNNKETKWFIECKHYTSGGVPPNDLNSKIAWADAEQPDYLVFFISSYLTNGARTWIDKIIPQKQYDITIVEGEQLKNRLLKYPELIERYFSKNRYEKLFKDVRDYKVKFNINPSFEFLKEIIDNIDLERLSDEEIGFLLINFYSQYESFEGRNEYHGDFGGDEANRILEFLKEKTDNEELKTFAPYVNHYDILGGTGFFEEMEWLDDEDTDYEIKKFDFQSYDLHLNHNKERDKWKIGYYLFVKYTDVAFEIFQSDSTEIRIIREFNDKRITDLSLKLKDNIQDDYNKYLENFSA